MGPFRLRSKRKRPARYRLKNELDRVGPDNETTDRKRTTKTGIKSAANLLTLKPLIWLNFYKKKNTLQSKKDRKRVQKELKYLQKCQKSSIKIVKNWWKTLGRLFAARTFEKWSSFNR
jgi:hypothetical protein